MPIIVKPKTTCTSYLRATDCCLEGQCQLYFGLKSYPLLILYIIINLSVLIIINYVIIIYMFSANTNHPIIAPGNEYVLGRKNISIHSDDRDITK